MRQAYWNVLNIVLDEAEGPVSSSDKLHGQPWMKYPTGSRGFDLFPGMHILEAGADVDSRDDQGKIPWDYAQDVVTFFPSSATLGV